MNETSKGSVSSLEPSMVPYDTFLKRVAVTYKDNDHTFNEVKVIKMKITLFITVHYNQ
jgi:hypothetical protein